MITASPRRLSVFKCVVDAGGFNLAAVRLDIAQPSVGAHIKALEDQIGQPLFHRRRGQRPTLTKAGEALYAYAADMLRRSQETSSALTDLRTRDQNEIALAIHRDVPPQFLAARLAAFSRRWPGVRISTRTGTIEDIVTLVRERIVNLAVLVTAGPIQEIDSDILMKVPLRLVVAPSHPLALLRRAAAADIADHPFVGGLRDSRYMQMVHEALRQCGIDRIDVTMELQDSASVKEMARLGAGIAALPDCTVAQDIAANLLVPLQLQTQPPDFDLRCAYRAPLAQITRAFRDDLRLQLSGRD